MMLVILIASSAVLASAAPGDYPQPNAVSEPPSIVLGDLAPISNDALLEIIGKLDLESRIACGRTCKSAHSIVESTFKNALFHQSAFDATLPIVIKFIAELQPSSDLSGISPVQVVVLYDRIMALPIQRSEREDVVMMLYGLIGDKSLLDGLRCSSSPTNRIIKDRSELYKFSNLSQIVPVFNPKQNFIPNSPYWNEYIADQFKNAGQLDRLSEPAFLIELLHCGVRFQMDYFLSCVPIIKEKLPDIFPLLSNGLWAYTVDRNPSFNWAFFRNVIAIRKAAPQVALDVIQLPVVVDHFLGQIDKLLHTLDEHGLDLLIEAAPEWIPEIVTHRTGPDDDQLLHIVCRKGDLDMAMTLLDVADFRSKNGSGFVPARLIPWMYIPFLLQWTPYQPLAAAVLESDPNWIISRYSAVIQFVVDSVFPQIDFVEALCTEFTSDCDAEQLRELFRERQKSDSWIPKWAPALNLLQAQYQELSRDRSNEVKAHVMVNYLKKRRPDALATIVNQKHWLSQSTLLHYAFFTANTELVIALLSAPGIDLNAKDRTNRVPFQFARRKTLARLLQEIPSSQMQGLVRSHTSTFVCLAHDLLTEKVPDLGGIQPLFNSWHLFKICLEMPTST